MMFGGILNVVLDPVFIFGCHLAVTGAALATAPSNVASVGFFLVVYRRLGEGTAVSLPGPGTSPSGLWDPSSLWGWPRPWPPPWAMPPTW